MVIVIREPEASFPYRLQTWPIEESVAADGSVDERGTAWNQAISSAFLSESIDDETVQKFTASYVADKQCAYAAYPEATVAGGMSEYDPVATFSSYLGTVNVGPGSLLPTNMITSVTVRSTHRRRGLMAALMQADLTAAKNRGLSMAALTVSEATIYGRFGFGEATRANEVTLDTSHGFAFTPAAAQAISVGFVDMVPVQSAGQIQADLFAVLHAQTLGSVSRPDAYLGAVTGEWSFESPSKDRNVRVAAHFGADGCIDGYVSYKQPGADSQPAILTIIDLLALNDNAYLALWDFLAGIDLSQAVSWSRAPQEDPLRWALADSRRYKVTGGEDLLWLRPLDVPEILRTRKFWSDGEVEFAVRDRMGFATGNYRLTVRQGEVKVATLDAAAPLPLSMDVAELGSLYLAGNRAALLLAAGRFGEPTSALQAAVQNFDMLFATPVPPFCRTDF